MLSTKLEGVKFGALESFVNRNQEPIEFLDGEHYWDSWFPSFYTEEEHPTKMMRRGTTALVSFGKFFLYMKVDGKHFDVTIISDNQQVLEDVQALLAA